MLGSANAGRARFGTRFPEGGERPANFGLRHLGEITWQVVGVLLAWAYVASLHATNDGLWYTGDAARHAANGLFWWDFLTRLPSDPRAFALSYYARYPVIDPASYPPVFYWIEGAAFALLGPSPFVAKGLVLGFALLTAFTVTAWTRRWVSKEAGWAGPLLLLQPGVVVWANTIMLNVPAMALGFAALHHGRRWLEAPSSKQLYLATAFGAAGILTYFPTAIILLVIPAWILSERRWEVLWRRQNVAVAFLFASLLLACLLVVRSWSPLHLSLLLPGLERALSLYHWTYYFENLPRLLSAPILGLLALGLLIGIWDQPYRREAFPVLVCAVACYFGLSVLVEREERYALFLVPPGVILSVVGLRAIARQAAQRLGGDPGRYFAAAMTVLIAVHVWGAPSVRVPQASGFREISAFFEEKAPNERVFYDGTFVGVFSFYVRAGDPEFRRGVVRGDKLLYASAIFRSWRLTERISSPAEAVEAFRTRCGCRWLAIERGWDAEQVAAARYLRQAVTGPEFELVKSFPVVAPGVTRVDVYRFLPPIEIPEEIELPFPVLGAGTILRAKPIESNR